MHISRADHDVTVKLNFVPTVMFNIDITNNPNIGSLYKGDVHVVTKNSATRLTSAVRQIMEIGAVSKDNLEEIKFLFIITDGGGDRNHRFDREQASLLWLT